MLKIKQLSIWFFTSVMLLESFSIKNNYANNSDSSRSANSIPSVESFYSLESSFDENECIDPIEKFAYNTRNKKKVVVGQEFIVAPKSPWIFVTNVPMQIDAERELQIAHTGSNGKIELWSKLIFLKEGKHIKEGYKIYYPKQGTWQEVSNEIDGSNGVFASSLFLLKDSIWSVNSWNSNLSTKQPLLSLYTDKGFESDSKTRNIPAGGYTLINSKGVFWFVIPQDAIYSYNTSTHNYRKVVKIYDNVRSASLSSDSIIYYTSMKMNAIGVPEWSLKSFDTNSEELKNIDLSYSAMSSSNVDPSNIFVDSLGRLWLGGLGWRDADKINWYRLHPSEIFITNGSGDSSTTDWQNPELILESHDGRFWFNSNNGMAWLDVNKKQWCWFTTFQSNIVEDSDHNLWMIADGKLYKNPLGK
jgi:hypothetical protein